MNYTEKNGDLLAAVPGFSLSDTLNCGQCFRWKQTGDRFHGIHQGHPLTISQEGELLRFYGISPEELETVWIPYFDLEGDYLGLNRTYEGDPVLKRACRFAGGIRILRQDPWEALCSFIISQNNNIPRIKGIVSRLCDLLGEPTGDDRSFPAPEKLAEQTEESLAPLRAGFRNGYLLDAARKVASGEVPLSDIETMPLDEARETLRKIRGVGPKVAECTLLYGFHRLDAFPIDTWIRKALERYFPDGFPEVPAKGVAQQYLFHSIRSWPEENAE